jgi:hypothetical protein
MQKDRDDGICMLLFVVREAFQESLGFSPFELVLGHFVGGPFCKKNGFVRACEIEHDNLKQSQDKMKHWYEKDVMIREFKSGEKVIVLLLIGCHPL